MGVQMMKMLQHITPSTQLGSSLSPIIEVYQEDD